MGGAALQASLAVGPVLMPAAPDLTGSDFNKGDKDMTINARQAAGIAFILLALIGLALSLGGGVSAADDIYTAYMPVVTKPSIILFKDDFSDVNSGWSREDFGDVKLDYQDDAYDILIRDKNVWAWTVAPVGGFSDYSVQAEVSFSSSTEDGYAGLVFDLVDVDNYYFFVVNSNDQWFGLAKVTDGVPALVVPATPSTEINSGIAMNLLKVKRVGPVIDLFVNNEVVAALENEGFGEKGKAGFYMRSNADREVTTTFDNFLVWLPREVTGPTSALDAAAMQPAAYHSGMSAASIFD